MVRAIVLDKAGYWRRVVDALRIMTPLVVLLRMMDGDRPIMGKIYDKMFMVGERIKKSKVSWKEQAAEVHVTRWEYLHSDMHGAGYALDPSTRRPCHLPNGGPCMGPT